MHEPRKRLHSARRKNLDTTWSRKMCLLLARRKRQARSGVQGLRLRYSRQDGRSKISPDEKFLPPDRGDLGDSDRYPPAQGFRAARKIRLFRLSWLRRCMSHVSVYTLPDAKIWTPLGRAKCASYWRDESGKLEAVFKDYGYDILGKTDVQKYLLMKSFSHQIGEILATVTDILQPKEFEQLVKYGFFDCPG